MTEEELPETHAILGFLNEFVEGISDLVEMGIGVTFTVNGTVISGQIISRDKWLAEMSKVFSTSSVCSLNQVSSLDVEGAGKMICDSFQEAADELREDFKAKPKNWVYLKDVDLIFLPSRDQIVKMPLWCISIEAVDGFSLSRLSFG